MIKRLSPRQGLVAVLAALAGTEPTGFLELRHRRSDGGGIRRRFFDAHVPNAAAMAATVLSQTGDVHVGCALRRDRTGGRPSVQQGWALWVDCSDPHTVAALEGFDPQPPILVRSGARELSAYWPLEQPLAAEHLELANRRLATALGAQQAGPSAAALMRPPATVNYMHDPPGPVTLERFRRERFRPEQITAVIPIGDA